MNKKMPRLCLCILLMLGFVLPARAQAPLASQPGAPLATATAQIEQKKVAKLTLQLAPASAILNPGERVLVNYRFSKTLAQEPPLVWAVDAPDVASVDKLGYVTARAPGKATISLSTEDGVTTGAMVLRVRGGAMRTVKLSAIGDVVLGGDKKRVPKADKYIRDGMTSFQRFKALYDRFGEDYFFSRVRDVFRSDSLTVANLEGQLTDRKSSRNKTVVLSGPSVYRTILPGAGIDVVNMANNHMDDFFYAGRRDTRRNLSAVGVKYYGEGSGDTSVVEVNGVRIGFAGFVTPVVRSHVQKAVRTLKKTKKCDIVVVSYHWARSTEWTSSVTSDERSLARFAVNCGADLVVGHHKHLVSGIERYKGRMIAYDLGNFLSMIRHVTAKGAFVSKDTIIFQQKFNVFEDGFVERINPSIIPCLSSDSLEQFTGQPRVATGQEAEAILDKVRAKTLSSSKELVRRIEGY